MRLLSLLFLLLAALPARAGDLATFEGIGHSPDGRHYAFMQHGVMDGSGAPYAEAFLIDATTDSFIAGTPVRLGGGEPGDLTADAIRARLAGLRAEARSLIDAAALQAGVSTDWRGGDILAHTPATLLGGDGRQMTVNPRYLPEPLSGTPITLSLDILPFANDTNDCPDFGQPIVGFRLTAEDGETIQLNEDMHVPASRGCPIDYRIGGVRSYYDPDGRRTLVVLVQMLTIGFEGPDGRWLAVTHHDGE